MNDAVRLARPDSADALIDTMLRRRSSRDFDGTPLPLTALAYLLWAALGDNASGTRTVPSAHGIGLVDVAVIVGEVDGIATGQYRYERETHSLRHGIPGDLRPVVARSSISDDHWLASAAAMLLLSADMPAANAAFVDQWPFGERGARYAWLEAGHMSQNVCLMATRLSVGAVFVAGFDDHALATSGVIPVGHHPLGVIAVGSTRDAHE